MKGGNRYLYISESHDEKILGSEKFYFYDEGEDSKQIRKELFLKKDSNGKTLLHMAAVLGDKYFSVMIVNEARALECLDEIIN